MLWRLGVSPASGVHQEGTKQRGEAEHGWIRGRSGSGDLLAHLLGTLAPAKVLVQSLPARLCAHGTDNEQGTGQTGLCSSVDLIMLLNSFAESSCAKALPPPF